MGWDKQGKVGIIQGECGFTGMWDFLGALKTICCAVCKCAPQRGGFYKATEKGWGSKQEL